MCRSMSSQRSYCRPQPRHVHWKSMRRDFFRLLCLLLAAACALCLRDDVEVVDVELGSATDPDEVIDICKSGRNTTKLSNSMSSSELIALLNGDVRLLLLALVLLFGGTWPAMTRPTLPLDDEPTDDGDGVEVLEEWPFEAEGKPESTDEPERLSAHELDKYPRDRER